MTPPGPALDETRHEDAARDYVREFLDDLKSERLELPSMPDVAIRVGRAVNDANTDSHDIARVIQVDPILTARLLKVVNSPAYGGRGKIESCPDAVTRLGRATTQNLIISFVLKNAFRTNSTALRKRMQDLWRHSARVAALCHVLAKITPGLSSDKAMLTGVLHDIGAIPLLRKAESYPELAAKPEVLDRIVYCLQPRISAAVLRKWEFADFYIEAALHSEDWMYQGGRQPDYVDLLVIAQLHAYVGTSRSTRLPRIDDVPAFAKLALGELTPHKSLCVLDAADQEIRQVETILNGVN